MDHHPPLLAAASEEIIGNGCEALGAEHVLGLVQDVEMMEMQQSISGGSTDEDANVGSLWHNPQHFLHGDMGTDHSQHNTDGTYGEDPGVHPQEAARDPIQMPVGESLSLTERPAAGEGGRCRIAAGVVPALLIPYAIILIALAAITFCTTYFVLERESQNVFEDAHTTVRLQLLEQVMAVVQIPETIVQATVALYVNNPMQPNANDRLMPIEGSMMQRLCATLYNADTNRIVSELRVLSEERNQAAICGRRYTPEYQLYGMQSSHSVLSPMYVIDSATMTFKTPLEEISTPIDTNPTTGFLSEEVLAFLKGWVTAYKSGKPYTGSYWVSVPNSTASQQYIYPFIERLNDTTGIGFLEAVLEKQALLQLATNRRNAGNSAVRFMLTGSTDHSDVLTVYATNWGQSSNDVHGDAPQAPFASTSAKTLLTTEITDPLMASAIRHVNLDGLLHGDVTERDFSFRYNGYRALVTVARINTTSTERMLLFIAVPQSAYAGKVFVKRDIIIGILVISVVFCIAVVYIVLRYWVSTPLSSVVHELKQASKAANVDDTKWQQGKGQSPIREIFNVQLVCHDLRRRLQEVRAYLPAGLITFDDSNEFSVSSSIAAPAYPEGGISTEGLKYPHASEQAMLTPGDGDKLGRAFILGREVIASGVLEAGRGKTNQFRRTECTILYAYFPESSSRAELTALIGTFMTVVVGAALRHGGCVESQRPECVSVSFGARQRLRAHALLAAQCAIDIAESLPQGLQQHVALVADTQTFLCGICGAHRRKALAVFGRDVSASVGSLQLRIGARVCVTEDCAQQLAGRVRALPVEVVFLEPSPFAAGGAASGTTRCVLYELSPGDVRAEQWVTYAQRYKFGFSAMERGNYKLALQAFSSVEEVSAATFSVFSPEEDGEHVGGEVAIPPRTEAGDALMQSRKVYSGQESRLIEECKARIAAGSVVPFVRLPADLPASLFPLSPVPTLAMVHDAVNQMEESPRPRRLSSVSCDVMFARRSLVDLGWRNTQVGDMLDNAVSMPQLHVLEASVSGDGVILDCNGMDWRCARANTGESWLSSSFLAISSTGTLAVVKVLPSASITDAGITTTMLSAFFQLVCQEVAPTVRKERGSYVSPVLVDGLPAINDKLRVHSGFLSVGAKAPFIFIERGDEPVFAEQETNLTSGVVRIISVVSSAPIHALVCEYISGGSLDRLISDYGRKMPRMLVVRMLVSLIEALAHLESIGVVHGAITLESVLVTASGFCKLNEVDITANYRRIRALGKQLEQSTFIGTGARVAERRGALTVSISSLPSLHVGKVEETSPTSTAAAVEEEEASLRDPWHAESVTDPHYCSPEIIAGSPRSSASDIFAVGMVILHALSGCIPWKWAPCYAEVRNPVELQALFAKNETFLVAVRASELEPMIPTGLPTPMESLLRQMCAMRPEERPRARACALMARSWIDEIETARGP